MGGYGDARSNPFEWHEGARTSARGSQEMRVQLRPDGATAPAQRVIPPSSVVARPRGDEADRTVTRAVNPDSKSSPETSRGPGNGRRTQFTKVQLRHPTKDIRLSPAQRGEMTRVMEEIKELETTTRAHPDPKERDDALEAVNEELGRVDHELGELFQKTLEVREKRSKVAVVRSTRPDGLDEVDEGLVAVRREMEKMKADLGPTWRERRELIDRVRESRELCGVRGAGEARIRLERIAEELAGRSLDMRARTRRLQEQKRLEDNVERWEEDEQRLGELARSAAPLEEQLRVLRGREKELEQRAAAMEEVVRRNESSCSGFRDQMIGIWKAALRLWKRKEEIWKQCETIEEEYAIAVRGFFDAKDRLNGLWARRAAIFREAEVAQYGAD